MNAPSIEQLVAAAEYVDFDAPCYRAPRALAERHTVLAPRA